MEPLQNGVQLESDEVGVVDADGACQRWSFPPVLDQFDLMDTETDPTELEAIFTDERYGQFRHTLPTNFLSTYIRTYKYVHTRLHPGFWVMK